MSAVFATRDSFASLKKDVSGLAKVDTSSKEFQDELSNQYRQFSNYKYFAFGVPNSMVITFLLPKRYPVTLRCLVGQISVAAGAYFTFRSAKSSAVTAMKKKLILQHYQQQTGESQPPDMDLGKLLLGKSSNIEESDIQVK